MTGIKILEQNFQEYPLKITPDGGNGSHEISLIDFNNMLKHLIITPATSTTSYKIRLTQADDTIIYELTRAVTGRRGIVGPEIPLIGTITIAILGASADEEFDIKLVYQ